VDEFAQDIKKLLDRATAGLENAARTTELRFYLMISLSERISFLLPKFSYGETIAKVFV